jgi:hypothetical protein
VLREEEVECDYSDLNSPALSKIGDRLWLVLENREYLTYIRNKLRKLTFFKGFISDLGSTPRILWWYMDPTEAIGAALIHDSLYRYHGFHISTHPDFPLMEATLEQIEANPHVFPLIKVTRNEADTKYMECLISTGTRKSKAFNCYVALRFLGWWSWHQAPKRRKQLPKYVVRKVR